MCRRTFIVTTAFISIIFKLEATICIAFITSYTKLRNSVSRRNSSSQYAFEKGASGVVVTSDSEKTNLGNYQRSTPRKKETVKSQEDIKINHRYKHQHKHRIRAMFQEAKVFERSGRWNEACSILLKILRIDPYDAHSHLAYARIQSRQEIKFVTSVQKESLNSWLGHLENRVIFDNSFTFLYNDTDTTSQARRAFITGTQHCPNSIHLWHAWAMHEESIGEMDFARCLYQKALTLDPVNPYVCHAFGLLQQRMGNIEYAETLLRTPLEAPSMNATCTAALVCSLGALLTHQGRYEEARSVYLDNVEKISSERQVSEVFLAAAWLEEKHFHDQNRAEELIHLTLSKSPDNSRALVALARLEGRRSENRKIDGINNLIHESGNKTIAKDSSFYGQNSITRIFTMRDRLSNLCSSLERRYQNNSSFSTSEVKDGRLFNTWANLEIQCGNYTAARDILARGMQVFHRDHSIVQAAGFLQEKLGNFSAADEFYSSSLSIQPSAPTLIAIAMLELRNRTQLCNITKVEELFEEALLLDHRHGPIYNAYGTMEFQRGNIEKARGIYIRGLQTRCTAIASVYHGLAKLELSVGNIETARSVLLEGLKVAEYQDTMMDNHQRDRASFLVHTLGMLELRCNRATEAKGVFMDGLRHGTSSQLLLGAALSDLKLGNEDRARHLFEQAVIADRKHSQAWHSWGITEMRSGNYRLAKALFELGIRNDPTYGALWQAYATLEGRRGNTTVARGLFASGVSHCPSHVPLYQAWACLELRSENIEHAKLLISEALTRDKSHGSSWLIAAKIEERLGNRGLVGLILQRGLECSPYDPELFRVSAEFEAKRGLFQKARSLYEKGLEIDPTYAPLYHSFAELEAWVGNIEGLAKLNKKAAQIFNTNALMPTQAQASVLRRKLRISGGVVPDGILMMGKELEMDVDELINFTDIDPEKIIQRLSDADFNELIHKIN